LSYAFENKKAASFKCLAIKKAAQITKNLHVSEELEAGAIITRAITQAAQINAEAITSARKAAKEEKAREVDRIIIQAKQKGEDILVKEKQAAREEAAKIKASAEKEAQALKNRFRSEATQAAHEEVLQVKDELLLQVKGHGAN
jgi:vacuolar-type H+-ATPase subunit H